MHRGPWSMGKYRKILVAVDGSESSRNALSQAFRFAVDEKCWITVTSVVPPYDGEIEIVGVKDIRAALRKPCEDALAGGGKLAETERVLDQDGLRGRRGPRTHRGPGRCRELRSDHHGQARAHAGRAHARRTASRRGSSAIPSGMCWSSRTTRVIGWKTIVFATDGSRYSAVAAERAIAFAQVLRRGAEGRCPWWMCPRSFTPRRPRRSTTWSERQRDMLPT